MVPITQDPVKLWVFSPLLLHVRVVELFFHTQVLLLSPEIIQTVNSLPVFCVVLHPHPAGYHQARHIPQVVHPEVLCCSEKILQVVAAHQVEEAASSFIDHLNGVAAGYFGHLGNLVAVAPEDFKEDAERTRIDGADVDISGATFFHLIPLPDYLFSEERKGLEL